jgi:Acyl-coenzyme A:6-aminopenicillanic acid acyl-transferase
MGRCQGEQLSDQVRGSQTLLDDLEAFRLAKPFVLPFGVYRWLARRKASNVWRDPLAGRAPAMDSYVRGIADGAGARLDELQLINLMEPILSDLRGFAQTGPTGSGCSAVALRHSRTTDRRTILARNFDYLPIVQPFYALRELRPTKGYRALEFTVASLAGAVDGVNEKGLAITNNYAYVTDDGTPAMTLTMAASTALAQCATVAEAETFFSDNAIWGGGVLMLADATGDIASLELSNTRRTIHRPRDGEDILFHTNRFRAGAMREVEVDDDAHYTNRAPVALRGLRIHESGDRRQARLRSLLAERGPMDLDGLHHIMGDHGPDGAPSLDSICMHSDYWFTTACAQLLPAERKIRIAFDSACQAEFVEFGL